jgi:peptide-methionine (R)-S-oxide reductase
MLHPRYLTDRRKVILAGLAAIVPVPALATLVDPFANSTWRRVTDADWKQRLPAGAYNVLRQGGTEHAWTSPLLNEHRPGAFHCLGCALPLFKSQWKFDSGTGWPSFFTVLAGAIKTRSDFDFGVERTEYHCARCLGHQGHVFDDGPRPTGLRYCNDGIALSFVPV